MLIGLGFQAFLNNPLLEIMEYLTMSTLLILFVIYINYIISSSFQIQP